MIIVDEIIEEAEEIFGHCNEPKLFRWITDAVELLANKGEIDPLVGFVDLCVDGECITLPREVETVLAVNIGGHPALGHDEVFSFHLNGPGDFKTSCNFSWSNTGTYPTYRDLKCPSKLVAFLDRSDDNGKMIRVFGYDEQNRPLRTEINGVWEDGYRVPTIFGYALPASNAPTISRITGIVKDRTVANVRLSSFDNSTSTGTLLGVFEPDETKPSYRRLKVHRACEWVRLMYRKRSARIYSLNDRILLHSRPALILAMHALKKYREYDLGNAMQFEAQATRLLTERENVLTSPVTTPIQVSTHNDIASHEEID